MISKKQHDKLLQLVNSLEQAQYHYRAERLSFEVAARKAVTDYIAQLATTKKTNHGSTKRCFLRDADNVWEFESRADALAHFKKKGKELYKQGKFHFASVHYADNASEIREVPDWRWKIGTRGGFIWEKP